MDTLLTNVVTDSLHTILRRKIRGYLVPTKHVTHSTPHMVGRTGQGPGFTQNRDEGVDSIGVSTSSGEL